VILAGIELRIESVDAFQGFDGPVILLDVIATAHQNKMVMARPKEDEPFSHFAITQTITDYVKSKYRQNVGMTRAKDGLVYFGHWESLSEVCRRDDKLTASGRAVHSGSALSNCIKDAIDRGFMVEDETSDDNPNIAYAESTKEALDEEAAREQERQVYSWMAIHTQKNRGG
jgi:hypothetical protein